MVHGPAGASIAGARRAARASLAGLALAASVLVACGSGGDGDRDTASLAWSGRPTAIVPPTLPRDRILRGEVENTSGDEIEMEAAAIRVLDQDGRPLQSSATFLSGYIHGLYPLTRGPSSLPEPDRVREGKVAKLAPDETVPLTVSWRDPPGTRRAARIDYGPGSLGVPEPEH